MDLWRDSSLAGISPHLTLTGNISGEGQLTKIGNGNLTISAANDWSGGLLVQDGTVILGSEEANIGGLGSGKITLKNSSLKMLNSTSSRADNCDFNLIIPQGSKSWLHLDGRCSLTGSLEGNGTLNFVSPYIRSSLKGD